MSSRRIDVVIRRFAQEIDSANRDIHQLTQTIAELEKLLREIDASGMRPDPRLSGEFRRLSSEVKELQTRARRLTQELADTDSRIYRAMM